MNPKHAQTLKSIFARPTRRNIAFRDFEALVRALGGVVVEREGSRVSFRLNGHVLNQHRPHPAKEMLRYKVDEAREWLGAMGVRP